MILEQNKIGEKKQVNFQYVWWKCDYRYFGEILRLLRDEN
jgi:hypothetical protein